MKNQKGFTHWVIVILISIMAVGLVGVAWYYEEEKKEVNTNTTNTPIIVAVNTNETADINVNKTGHTTGIQTGSKQNVQIDTTDWQQYTNETYNFSLRFPPEFTASSSVKKDWQGNEFLLLSTEDTEKILSQTTGERSDSVVIYPRQDPYFLEMLGYFNASLTESYFANAREEVGTFFLKTISVNNKTGFQFKSIELAQGNKYTIFENNDKTLFVVQSDYGYGWDEYANETRLEPHDSIISTIRFLNN